MFDTLSQKLTKVFEKITKRGLLTQENINSALRDVRMALLDADVALPVVKDFLQKVSDKAIGQKIVKSVSASEMMIKLIHDELVSTLGKKAPFVKKGVILLVGLQGSGKTTTAGKLAYFLKQKVLLVSLDVYRPAAQEQLKQIAEQNGFEIFPIGKTNVKEIYTEALKYSKAQGFDYVIFDTAGRLHIDDTLMDELKMIQKDVRPVETFLVADAMIGQDAAVMAQSFKDNVSLTGVILTRVDGDARGGAALSLHMVTECPIRFMGVGEKIEQLELFDPERVASRILDMGDIVSFVEQAEQFSQSKENESVNQNIEKGRFDLNDMMVYINQMESMGGLKGIMRMLPGFKSSQNQLSPEAMDDKLLKRQVAIINSMTPKERRNPKVLNGPRKKRIAQGSGVEVSAVNRLLNQYEEIKQMMKQFGMFGKDTGDVSKFKNFFGF